MIFCKDRIIQTKKDLKSSFAGLENIPGLLIAKDLNSNYSIITNDYARLLGWKDSDQCEGLTDFDIPCQAVEAAPQFVLLDQKAVKNDAGILSLYVCNYSNGLKVLLSSKKPIFNEQGVITGIFGQVTDVSQSNIFQWIVSLKNSDKRMVEYSNNSNIYIINSEQSPLPLTKRQQSCLFLLIRGKTTKEIGAILNLSPRTIEEHISALKIKLDCFNKSQLIEKAIDTSFVNFVPMDMLERKINL